MLFDVIRHKDFLTVYVAEKLSQLAESVSCFCIMDLMTCCSVYKFRLFFHFGSVVIEGCISLECLKKQNVLLASKFEEVFRKSQMRKFFPENFVRMITN